MRTWKVRPMSRRARLRQQVYLGKAAAEAERRLKEGQEVRRRA